MHKSFLGLLSIWWLRSMHGKTFSDRYGSSVNQSLVIVAILPSVIVMIYIPFFVKILFLRSRLNIRIFYEDFRENIRFLLNVLRLTFSRNEFGRRHAAIAVLLFLGQFCLLEKGRILYDLVRQTKIVLYLYIFITKKLHLLFEF